ncbi:MAG: phage tail tube protein [Candidatus Bathyarchaeia archaeon]|jgi:hypothetical protein
MPETYSSNESKIYYVDETTYGTTPLNPAMLGIPAESIEPTINPNNIKLRGVGSMDLQAIKKGLKNPSIKLSYPLPSDSPINFLQYAKAELAKSLSLQVLYYKDVFSEADEIISLLYTGCKIQTATVQCSVEDVIKADVELLGQDVVTSTSKISGATYSDYAGAIPFYESYVKKDASTLERVTDWKFTIANNLRQVPVIRNPNGNILKYMPYRYRDLTGEVTFEFETKEEFDDIINDRDFTLEFGLGATNKATFSNCKWENTQIPTRIEDLVNLKATFVAKTFTIT